jgi:hypothetical protein
VATAEAESGTTTTTEAATNAAAANTITQPLLPEE